MEFNMHYYMEAEDGIIIAVGISSEPIFTEITKEEYTQIRQMMANAPSRYKRLNENLEWVSLDEIDDTEALSILTGESE